MLRLNAIVSYQNKVGVHVLKARVVDNFNNVISLYKWIIGHMDCLDVTMD